MYFYHKWFGRFMFKKIKDLRTSRVSLPVFSWYSFGESFGWIVLESAYALRRVGMWNCDVIAWRPFWLSWSWQKATRIAGRYVLSHARHTIETIYACSVLCICRCSGFHMCLFVCCGTHTNYESFSTFKNILFHNYVLWVNLIIDKTLYFVIVKLFVLVI